MKNDLSCGVVRDLLPLYAEGLTGEDSNQAIMEHMSRCGECRELYKSLCPGEAEQTQERERELDYLKEIKRRNRRRVWLAVGCTAGAAIICFILIICAELFIIGQPATSRMDLPAVSTEDGILRLEFINPDSARSYARWSTDYVGQADGTGRIYINARTVLSSPIHPEGSHVIELNLVENSIEAVSFAGWTLWERGLIISPLAEDIFSARSPYVGDAPAMGRLLGLLKTPAQPYKMSIQSDRQPYGLSIEFEAPLSQGDNELMEKNAVIMLAEVANLGELSWSYPDEQGEIRENTLTDAQAEELVRELISELEEEGSMTDSSSQPSVKALSASPYLIEQLLKALNY